MARLARVVAPGMPHLITQRGNRRQTTFFCDEDYLAYRELMAHWCGEQRVQIWAYCLMPNHVHLIAVPKTAEGLCEQNDVRVYQYAYDEQGDQVSIIDPKGHETRFSYDDRGRELTRTLPIGVETTGIATDCVEQKFYDEQGRLDYEVSFEGVVTSYVYDDRQGA